MTRDELYAEVWAGLPVKKHLLGRRRVARIVDRALRQWPVAVLHQCDEGQADVVGKYMARSITRDEANEVGMGFIAAIVLGTIISEIIKQLLKKWWSNHAEMTELCR